MRYNKYRVEDIIDYIDSKAGCPKYSFVIREHSSPFAEYGNEAIVYTVFNNEHVGIIFDFNPFNPHIYYTEREVKKILSRLEQKANRILLYYGGKERENNS